WLYQGDVFPLSGEPRGRPAAHLRVESFIYCIQNHDQIGNRAFGDRLSATISPAAYRAAAMVLLFLPMTPLLFQGEEWGASTPFQYFTDHDEELGKLVSAGRREEFKRFTAFADPATRARIPDPQAPSTFEASKLDWDEHAEAPHAETLALYAALLRMRREDPVLAHVDRESLSAEAHGHVLVVRCSHRGATRALLANLSNEPANVPIVGRIMLASTELTLPALPAWGAAIVEVA
ncbi:MAG TPA: DUF3459 domain-containing protein, partial [Kofleriaceae bacterium]|nr:DUF3459 domain-containing protein [Kofleriaceae bacterium]